MSNQDDNNSEITLGDTDTIDIDLGSSMADDICISDIDITQPFGGSYYTIGDPMNTITLGSVGNPFTDTYASGPEITIGKFSLNEKKLEKLNALLDILSDDPEWAERINTQIAFNKLRNNNGD